MKARYILTYALLALTGFITPAYATDNEDSEAWKEYVPKITGVIRARYEVATENGMGRFQVRNARLQVQGNVGPVFDYYINTDFCDRGKVKILDAWGQGHLGYGVSVRLGQFRQPFGMDSFLGPTTYLFNNRSFIGKYMSNVRAVGAQVQYTATGFPATVAAGIFNPKDMSDHSEWTHQYAYAARLILSPGPLKLYTGIQSEIPDSVRFNLWNLGAHLEVGQLTLEAEYMNEHYTNQAHKACHGWLAVANYYVPVKWGDFNRISFQARFDGMTGYSTGKRSAVTTTGSDGVEKTEYKLITDQPGRNRLTVGTTLSSIIAKRLFTDIRLNYEKYFYRHDAVYDPTDGDRLSLELILSF